jgi:hypothetical protein
MRASNVAEPAMSAHGSPGSFKVSVRRQAVALCGKGFPGQLRRASGAQELLNQLMPLAEPIKVDFKEE